MITLLHPVVVVMVTYRSSTVDLYRNVGFWYSVVCTRFELFVLKMKRMVTLLERE